ncbi:MAG: hypothetical protein ACOCV2_12765, partial [Persicimonas sp.]
STVAGRLSRSYQLRKRAGHGNDRAGSGGSTASPESGEQRGGDRVEMKANFSRSSLRAGMPVGGRLRELRVRAERRLEAGETKRAVGDLYEMLALAPQHPWALEKLIAYLRRSGDEALARHFQKRLDDRAPY